MGYIPKDAKWYLARLVQEITVEGDPRNVVHTNLVLVRADSPEEAYQKAIELGAQGEIAYESPQGRKVTTTFRGLHGAELEYAEQVNMDEAALKRWSLVRKTSACSHPSNRQVGRTIDPEK